MLYNMYMKQNISIKVNSWVICAVLLVANLITVGLWQPWNGSAISNRTITITGSTTIQAEPDQFVFNPYYQKTGSDQTTANTDLSNLSKTITAKLKDLGVADSSIKTNVSTYDYPVYYNLTPNSQNTTTLYLTVTINDKTLAQKVQDYLVTTTPVGSVTPQMSFSVAMQKDLETQARDAALSDAKAKADAATKQLNSKIGKVVKVNDIAGSGATPLPWLDSISKTSDSSSTGSYAIQPGLNDYSFSIEVTYELN